MADDDQVDAAVSGPERRVLDATLACIARWGIAKTSLDDVAREAGLSRATIYRLLPGGKDTLVEAVVVAEVDRFLGGLGARLTAAGSLRELLVHGILFASRELQDHRALQYVLANEPEQILPHVAFSRFDRVLEEASAKLAPALAPHLGESAARTAEWVTRLVVSYALADGGPFDFTTEVDVERFVDNFLLPTLVPAAPQPI